ncbi:PIN domain-containing protein [Acidihalobacter yilgarnensis]|uniref:PIN domain-containing protein n=1 Tax=Acidihalobacter yilgarnensis TaxID=2819280 RepID=A0A1D8IS81_9GAMM|nr:PIN domain-containing protein [Acidihalobacter yilgarnensis]AOU99326.1 PIN domain-containing protein [Acidihalobacter yilgarnensis]
MRFIVVYDACVLYPAPLRDLLIRLAVTGLFAAKWTDQIHDEWIRNLVARRPELKKQMFRIRELMDDAVEDCLVTGYESLVDGLDLPDPDDRHVLAAAIRAGAQLIVTCNLRDFPADKLEPYGIEAVHPDQFIVEQMDLHEGAVIEAVKQQRASLKNPPKSVDDHLDTLSAQGLVVTADRLKEYRSLI